MDYKKLVQIADGVHESGEDSCADSIAEKLNNEEISLSEAREQLYRCGQFSTLPTDRECIDYLNEQTTEGVDNREVVKRVLDPMLEEVGLSLVWDADGIYMIYDQDNKIVSPVKFYDEMVGDYGEDEVVMANDEQDALLMSEQFNDLYELLM